MAQAFALRFISGKYQGGEFPLENDREFIVGRSSELDMVLVEDMVSRKHAKISTKTGQIVITDMGSTNGTFVNGEKVRKTRLKEGDRILIGTSILKVVAASRAQSASEAREHLAEVGKKQREGSTMSGTLEEVPVPDLLQLFSTSKRTGILHIRSDLGYGKIYLRSGDVFYSSIDDDHDLGPMKSFCRIVGWDQGNFEFGAPDPEAEFMIELEDPTESTLMEALRQLDEFRRIARDLPRATEVLRVPRPLSPGLSTLQALELDVFQLVYNHGPMQHVFDQSPATDYETARALLALLNQGFLLREGPS
ncbi:MAG: FHA domain-containing protein [Myxococcota bacterium]